MDPRCRSVAWIALALATLAGLPLSSSSHAASAPKRFAWKGAPGQTNWTWELQFEGPRLLGAISQVLGDHPFVLRHAPRTYEWQYTTDRRHWRRLRGARVDDERRLLRRWPLPAGVEPVGLRMVIDRTQGDFPAVQELRLEAPSDPTPFPAEPWIVVVNSTHDGTLPGHGQEFIPLARSCPGWEHLHAQQIWVPDLDPAFLEAEPRPLAVFLSGSFKDWCEVDRSHWRGVERVLKQAKTPLWASCGGAQALAILADRGTARPWDCPHCRDPRHPALPIYGHIGHRHAGAHACGDYADCVFERGPLAIRQAVADPVFAGLPGVFPAMESHCGQIEYAPRGWDVIAVGGPGTLTKNQCLRLRDRPVYAAQFHIEMDGTPESSRAIMANFLALARDAAR